MRRILLIAAAGLAAVAIVAAAVLALGDDDGAERRSAATSDDTTTSVLAPLPGQSGELTTTTQRGAPITSGGAAPVSGALLSKLVDDPGGPVDVGEETDCAVLDGSLEPQACVRARGSGGQFLVYVGRRDDDALQARLYRATAAGGYEFAFVRRTDFFRPDADVVGVSLIEAEVGGEVAIVVDYDFGGSGGVHSFDVVAWDAADEGPRVAAFINGNGGDRVVPGGPNGSLRFVGANYDDGAPTCCPNFADVRSLTHARPGEWAIASDTVPFSDAP